MAGDDQSRKIGYTLIGISAAFCGYAVFSELGKTDDETLGPAMKFLSVFWVMFVLLGVKRFLWDSKPASAKAPNPKKPAPAKTEAKGDDEDEEPSGAARRRARREK